MHRRSIVVSTLGITQTLAWGSTYYLAAVFADPISDTLQLPHSWFFGIFSASLLLSGLLGPLAGRIIDEHGGRDVLAATNLVFAAGLACLSFAGGIASLTFAWAIIGIGMGFGLYEAAFATATGLYGREARNAITGITLFAGFASTVGWPTSAFFIEQFGWRGACIAWAVLHLIIGLPMNRLLVPKGEPCRPEKSPEPEAASSRIPWTMIVLAGVFGATWCVATALAAHLPRLLQAMGVATTTAIFAASLVGPAQVAARLVEFTLLKNLSPMISARLATALHPLGAMLLAFFAPSPLCPSCCCMAPATACSRSHAARCRSPSSARPATASALASSRRPRAFCRAAPRFCSASFSTMPGRSQLCCSRAPSWAFLSSRCSP
jgi:MFS family permease